MRRCHEASRYLNLNSYGRTWIRRGSAPACLPSSTTRTACCRSSGGSCRHTQSMRESTSLAKSSRYQCRSFGTASFPGVDTPTAACRYSLFAASSSSSTPAAVYTLTCTEHEEETSRSSTLLRVHC
uniref:Uncharacterized protein n=1 Tax=Arundo donax TaxID=35708 RepID=A0A0A9DNH9_ARUDO